MATEQERKLLKELRDLVEKEMKKKHRIWWCYTYGGTQVHERISKCFDHVLGKLD